MRARRVSADGLGNLQPVVYPRAFQEPRKEPMMTNYHQSSSISPRSDETADAKPTLQSSPSARGGIVAHQGLLRLLTRRIADLWIARHQTPTAPSVLGHTHRHSPSQMLARKPRHHVATIHNRQGHVVENLYCLSHPQRRMSLVELL